MVMKQEVSKDPKDHCSHQNNQKIPDKLNFILFFRAIKKQWMQRSLNEPNSREG